MDETETETLLGHAREIAERQLGGEPGTDVVLAVFRRLCAEWDELNATAPEPAPWCAPEGEILH